MSSIATHATILIERSPSSPMGLRSESKPVQTG
jgi:hypothetical protein